MMSVPPEITQGSLFADRYRVGRVLGQGAMGIVVGAEDVETGARVAIKFLLPAHRNNPRAVTRLRREARTTGRLSSEHVVRVLAVGEVPGSAVTPPLPYFVMEHLEGRDLRSVVDDDGPLSPRRAAAYVSQACHALADAHALGIVHRDVKPSNLFVARRGDGHDTLKVLDFGVAKLKNEGGACLTSQDELVGSVTYMAPEQVVDARDVDARADIWSLGVILYYLVTGQKPFDGDDRRDVLYEILWGAPRPLLEVRPDLPEAFAEIVHRCLEKDRERRYASATALARALAPFMFATHARPASTGEVLPACGVPALSHLGPRDCTRAVAVAPPFPEEPGTLGLDAAGTQAAMGPRHGPGSRADGVRDEGSPVLLHEARSS